MTVYDIALMHDLRGGRTGARVTRPFPAQILTAAEAERWYLLLKNVPPSQVLNLQKSRLCYQDTLSGGMIVGKTLLASLSKYRTVSRVLKGWEPQVASQQPYCWDVPPFCK